MRARLALGLAVTAVAAGAFVSAGRTASAADCSLATALKVAKPYFFDPTLSHPIAQVLCGEFLGPGSEAMAVTFSAPTCAPVQSWAVFAVRQGAWKLVKQIPAYLVPPLVAVGNDIRETTTVSRPGDPRCLPTGGTHARTWHWTGTSFEPGAWKQVTPGDAIKHATFDSPQGVECWLSDDPAIRESGVQVYCRSVRTSPLYMQTVTMGPEGRLTRCTDHGTRNRCNIGNAGEDRIPVLRYGSEITVGRFLCRSAQAGVTCTVARSGRGFLINRDRIATIRG